MIATNHVTVLVAVVLVGISLKPANCVSLAKSDNETSTLHYNRTESTEGTPHAYIRNNTELDNGTFNSNDTSSSNATSVGRSVVDDNEIPRSLRNKFLCFSCTASSLGEYEPNANCTEPLSGFVEAVMKGVDVIPCESGECYTDVIRLGDYLSVFRGCRQRNDDLVPFKVHNFDTYNCTRLTLLGKAMWWSCGCSGSLCNKPLPPV